MKRRLEQNFIRFGYAKLQRVQMIIPEAIGQRDIEAAASVALVDFGDVGTPLIGVEAQPLVITFMQ